MRQQIILNEHISKLEIYTVVLYFWSALLRCDWCMWHCRHLHSRNSKHTEHRRRHYHYCRYSFCRYALQRYQWAFLLRPPASLHCCCCASWALVLLALLLTVAQLIAYAVDVYALASAHRHSWRIVDASVERLTPSQSCFAFKLFI